MPKILITGNGFDINLNLPTRYNQIIKLLDGLNDSNKKISSLYSLLDEESKKELYNTYDIFKIKQENHKLIEELIELKEKNIWLSFFKEEYDIETWIDFENKISFAYTNISKSIDKLNESLFSKNSIKSIKNNIFSYKDIDNKIENILLLKKFNIITFPDSKNKFTIKDNSNLKKREGYIVEINKEKIFNKLYSELNDLKKILNLYFLCFVFPLYDIVKNTPIDKNIFKSINYHYTFNYTPSFEKFYKSNTTTKYLHGKANKTDNNIVLGISNHNLPKIENNQNIINFLKKYQKLTLNTDYKFINEVVGNYGNLKYYIEDTYFFLFGHSLDYSDKDYLIEIIDFLNKAKNISIDAKLVIIIKNSKSKPKLIKNLFLVIGETKTEELMRDDILLFVENESTKLKEILDRKPKSPFFN